MTEEEAVELIKTAVELANEVYGSEDVHGLAEVAIGIIQRKARNNALSEVVEIILSNPDHRGGVQAVLIDVNKLFHTT